MTYKETLKEAILARYAIFDRPLNGKNNVLIDSFMPSLFLKHIQYEHDETFPKTFCAISEFTAKLAGVPLIDREQLFRMLGYSKKDIKELLRAVKRKNIDIAFLGLGGTGSNTIYWLKEMCRITNTVNLFKDITIFENDSLSVDNILRMPMDTSSIHCRADVRPFNGELKQAVLNRLYSDIYASLNSKHNNKEQFTQDEINKILDFVISSHTKENKLYLRNKVISKDAVKKYIQLQTVNKLYLFTKEYSLLSTNKPTLVNSYYKHDQNYYYYSSIGDGRSVYISPARDIIYYGAPDLATRQSLKAANKTLITATHGDDDCSIHLNPEQDTSLQIESYGVIKLGAFFMNQIRMAIGLLELLASDVDLTSSQEFLSYSYLNNDKTLPTDRTYNLQLEHSGLLSEGV